MTAPQQSHLKRQIQKLVFAWLAVTALILSTACNSKNGSPPPGPPPTTVQAAATPTPTPSPHNPKKQIPQPVKGHGIPGSKHGGLDGDSSHSSQDENGGGAPNVQPGDTPPPIAGSGDIILDPRGMKPAEIFASSDQQGQSSGGEAMPSSEGLVFTGGGQDVLREQLEAMERAKDEAVQARDHELAMDIGLSTFVVDWNSRRAFATITLAQSNKRYEFKGILDNQLRLRGGDLRSGGLTLDAICMDSDGGCQTVHMRIRQKTHSGLRTANILARHSIAYIYSEGIAPDESNNPEYARLMGIFVNTANRPDLAQSVHALSFYTSEAILGRSEFAVSMRVGVDPYRPRLEQIFALNGPLVKPADSSDMNLIIARPSGLISINGHTLQMQGSLMNTIRETRLVKNDGRGDLQFDITVRKGSARADEQTIRLTVARVHQTVKSPILRD